jgi:hypothetical protein
MLALLLVGVAAWAGCSKEVITMNEINEPELMSRWNAAAGDTMVQGFGNFQWTVFNQFPHPTYKGGSQEAYTRFAEVMVRFFDANWDYLVQNKLFTFPLTASLGLMTTFEDLTNMLLTSDLVQLSADNRQKLQDDAAKMQAMASA